MIYTVTLNPAIDKELTVASISADTVLRATKTRSDVGGKGFNVSRMLNVLGASSTALAFAGGSSGQQLEAGLAGLGIETDFVWVEGETRTNVSIVSTESPEHIKVNEAGPSIDIATQQTMLDKIQQLAAADDWWVLGGSLPPGVSADFYAQIITNLNNAKANVILDTSGEPLRLGCAAHPFLIKPNGDEAQQLTNQSDPQGQAQGMQALGAKNVIISLGKDGAIAVTPDATHQIAAPTIRESNPIGAGDAMVAGTVWALAQGESFETALRWGVACGATAASSVGTSMGTKAQIMQLYNEL